MSRSDGKFPSFLRIKLDPHTWPLDYWDNAFRCSNCQTNWPAVEPWFVTSPCCNASTSRVEYPPDYRWPQAIIALLNSRFDSFYDEWNDGASDDDLTLEEALNQLDHIEDHVGTELSQPPRT